MPIKISALYTLTSHTFSRAFNRHKVQIFPRLSIRYKFPHAFNWFMVKCIPPPSLALSNKLYSLFSPTLFSGYTFSCGFIGVSQSLPATSFRALYNQFMFFSAVCTLYIFPPFWWCCANILPRFPALSFWYALQLKIFLPPEPFILKNKKYRLCYILIKPTWIKNSCKRQSSHGSATSIGRASLETSDTLIIICINCNKHRK